MHLPPAEVDVGSQGVKEEGLCLSEVMVLTKHYLITLQYPSEVRRLQYTWIN
jgi:hypothetical protein